MRIDAEVPTTGKKFTGEAEKLTDEDTHELNQLRTPELHRTEWEVGRYIDNLETPSGMNA